MGIVYDIAYRIVKGVAKITSFSCLVSLRQLRKSPLPVCKRRNASTPGSTEASLHVHSARFKILLLSSIRDHDILLYRRREIVHRQAAVIDNVFIPVKIGTAEVDISIFAI